MRLQLTITMLAAMAAFPLVAADNPPKPEPKVEAVAPVIDSKKFWRLLAQAQATRQQLNDSPAGKAAVKADEAVQEAQAELAKACGGDKFVLGYGADGDLACVAKPKPPAAPAEPDKK